MSNLLGGDYSASKFSGKNVGFNVILIEVPQNIFVPLIAFAIKSENSVDRMKNSIIRPVVGAFIKFFR